jgi:magnesium chelatase family protein
MLGGGVPPRPGEISLAHHGVLFLDELPEFSRHVLEALREPLETGCVHLARGSHQVAFAAQFQLIAAMNPCPCGLLGATPPACRCSPEQVQRYQARLSGPLLDRIDMQVSVPALPPEVLLNPVSGETTAQVQARCQQAHDRAMARRGVRNHALNPAQLMALPISASAQQHLQEVAARQAWSARLVHRCLRLAQTIADLAQADEIDQVHLAQAVHYRALGLGRPA